MPDSNGGRLGRYIETCLDNERVQALVLPRLPPDLAKACLGGSALRTGRSGLEAVTE